MHTSNVFFFFSEHVYKNLMSFTFMHLGDAFIQSDLQCIQAIHFFSQYMCSLGIEPTTFVLLTECAAKNNVIIEL